MIDLVSKGDQQVIVENSKFAIAAQNPAVVPTGFYRLPFRNDIHLSTIGEK
jgi:hypothetical protein